MAFSFPQTAASPTPARKPGDAPAWPSHLSRLGELEDFWNEFALRSGKESFNVRFPREIQRLARHRSDFPCKSPAMPLRALELKVFLAFRHEFPEAAHFHACPRLRAIAERPFRL